MGKRGLIYIGAGVICALGAVLLVRNYITSSKKNGSETVNILVATAKIERGSPLILKKQEEQEPNVGFVPWPKRYLPEGAVTEEIAEKVQKEEYLAAHSYVANEPVLKDRLLTRAQMVPEGMFRIELAADSDSVAEPGRMVDVWKRVPREGATLLVRCARVHAVEKGEKGKEGQEDAPPRIYLVLPEEMREAVEEAKKQYKLIVRLTVHECGDGGAELVRSRELVLSQQASEALGEANGLLEQGQYSAALQSYQHIVTEFPSTEAARKAAERIRECRQALAEALLKEIKEAMGRKDYPAVVQKAEDIEKRYPQVESVLKQARQLRAQAQNALRESQREADYRRLVTDLQEAMKGGNIPQAQQLLERLEKQYADYSPPPALMSPAEVKERISRRLGKMAKEFQVHQRVMQYVLEENDRDKALERFEKLQQDYPRHPYVAQVREELKQREWLQQK